MFSWPIPPLPTMNVKRRDSYPINLKVNRCKASAVDSGVVSASHLQNYESRSNVFKSL